MKCNICNSETNPSHKATILNKYEIQYFSCPDCFFTQTEEPYWLEEAYSNAISQSDTGIMSRNIHLSKFTSIIIFLLCNTKKKFLDFGGGYGIFTRLMRDNGFDFYWYDKYANNILARGYEGKIDNSTKFEAITSFENIEHLQDPLDDIELMLNLSNNVIFSTHLMPPDFPTPKKWWYYCLEHGQHISLFSYQSLEFIAKKNHFNLISDGRMLHVFTKNTFSKKYLLLSKLLLKLGLSIFFTKKSKSDSDMKEIIKKMENQ